MDKFLTCLAVVGTIAATTLTLMNYDSPAVVGVFLLMMVVLLVGLNSETAP